MDTSTVAIIAVVGFVVLGGVLLLAAARRNETTKAIGALSRETRAREMPAHTSPRFAKRARPPPRARSSSWQPRSSVASPASNSSPPARPPPPPGSHPTPTPSAPPDASSSTGPSPASSSSASRASARRASPSCGPSSAAASAPRSTSATSTSSRPRSRPTAGSSTSPKAGCGSPSTRPGRSRRPVPCTRRPSWPAWRPGVIALYQKCVHLGCRVPAVRHLAVVRVPVPRQPVQPGGREEGRPGTSGPRPLRHERDRWRPHGRHRHHHPGSAHRHQHHRPGSGGPALHRVRRGALIPGAETKRS